MDDFAPDNIEQVLAELKQKAKDDPGNPVYPAQLAARLQELYERTGDLDTLEQAIASYEQALELTPDDHPDRSGRLNNLGNALLSLYQRTGDLDALKRAGDVLDRALELIPNDHPDRPMVLNNLGDAFFLLYERTGNQNVFERATACYNQALELTPEDHPDRPGRLNNLGNTFLSLYERTGDLDALRRANDVFRQALELTPEDHLNRPGRLNNLGNTLSYLYDHTGDPKAIERTISYYNKALELIPEDHLDYPTLLNNLGNALLSLYQRTGDLDALKRASDVLDRALELTPDDHPDRSGRLNNLGNTLLDLYERTGDLDALEQAVAALRQALELTPDDHPDRSGRLNNLGNTLLSLYERTGDLNILGKAINNLRQALELIPEDHLNYPTLLNNLGSALLSLYERTGDLDALKRAIYHYNQAVSTPKDHPDRPAWLNNLGNALLSLYERIGDLEYIEQARDVLNKAIELTSEDHPYYPSLLNNLGNALLSLYQRTGDLDALKRASDVLDRALELTPDDHPDRSGLLNNLGNVPLSLYERTGDLDALKRALDCYGRAVESVSATHHPDRSGWLNNLGNTFLFLYERTGDQKALDRAVDALKQALDVGGSLNPGAALVAGQDWINFSYARGMWPELKEAYQLTLAALGRYTAYQTDRRDLTHTLSNFQALPALAAWAQIELGDYREAVTALESGRTFVLRESLERGRRDLERLPWLGYGDLYERFKGAEQEILKLERTPFEHRPPDWLSRADKARKEFERAAKEIREKVGDKHPEYRFLMRPLPFSEIQKLVTETGAPLVYLSATPKGGLALVVREEGDPRLVRLPGLAEEHLREVLAGSGGKSNPDPRSYLGAYGRWIENASDQEMRAAWFEAIEHVLDFLGEALAPLREFLGAEGYNRATLIPDGALAILPLHAARFKGGTYFLEHHAFSYAPSAHALYYALLARRGSESEPLLAVENPTGDLPFAPLEVEAVREHFTRVEHFAREEATVEIVKKALLEAGVFHFSGHGAGGWSGEEPRLQLVDGVLNLSELLRAGQILDRLRLVVLSACETGVPDEKAFNEVLGLPAGFLLAGAPGVAGSLWSVSDAATALLIMRFYEELCSKNADAAEALREAQAWMLRASPEEKKDSLTRLDAEFRAALAGTRMSPEVAKGMSNLIESGGRKAEHPYYWAAFGYYGVPVELERCGKRREN